MTLNHFAAPDDNLIMIVYNFEATFYKNGGEPC